MCVCISSKGILVKRILNNITNPHFLRMHNTIGIRDWIFYLRTKWPAAHNLSNTGRTTALSPVSNPFPVAFHGIYKCVYEFDNWNLVLFSSQVSIQPYMVFY